MSGLPQKPPVKRRFRFTQRAVEALPPHDAAGRSHETEYTDEEVRGLKLCVTVTGRKTFYLRYTVRGRKKAVRIGEFGPHFGVADARREALQLKADVSRGGDPQQERVRQRAIPTFRDFAMNEYMPHAKANKRSWLDDERRLNYRVLPEIGDVPLDQLTTARLQRLLNGMAQELAPASVNRHISLLSRMFTLAVHWGHLEKSPFAGIKKFKETNRRERYLRPDETRRLLEAMEGHPHRMGMALFRFLLYTGTRLGEAQKAEWQFVDLDAARWWVPLTKAGQGRWVLLNPAAVELLRGLPRHPSSPLVFHQRDGGLIKWPQCMWKNLCRKAGVEDLRIHDLRHSFASAAINSGATLYEVQHLLGHRSSVTTTRYAHLAEDNLRRVSNRVADHVTASAQGVTETGTG